MFFDFYKMRVYSQIPRTAPNKDIERPKREKTEKKSARDTENQTDSITFSFVPARLSSKPEPREFFFSLSHYNNTPTHIIIIIIMVLLVLKF